MPAQEGAEQFADECVHAAHLSKVSLRLQMFFSSASIRAMTPEQLVKHFGSIASAADATDYTAQSIRNWLRAKAIPTRTQHFLEFVTGGKLRAQRGRRNGR